MKNIDFEIADKSALSNLYEQDDDAGLFLSDDYELLDEGDAYALEDLLRLVQMGDDDIVDRSNIEILSDEDALIWGLSYLVETPLGRAMAFDARFEDWALEVDDLESSMPQIDPQLRILILPRGTPSVHAMSQSPHYRHQFLVTLARGLRLIWQSMNGVHARTDISIDDQILFERLRTADQDVVMLRMAWELRDRDGGAMWRHLIADDVGDLITLSAGLWDTQTAHQDNLPEALLHLFRVYLGSDELINRIDARTLDDIDTRLQRGIENVCGPQLLHANDILALSRLPNMGSYLAPLARSILFAEDMRHVPDPILEAHMRQIIEDCGFVFAPPLVFTDTALQEKIFPNHKLDTLA